MVASVARGKPRTVERQEAVARGAAREAARARSAAGSRSSSAPRPASARPTPCSQAARERQREGVDVVVGVVETHGRAETEALLDGLEVVPRQRHRVPRHRRSTRWTSTRSSRAARSSCWSTSWRTPTRPAAAIPKRYSDVEELLDAGIDVYTTVNIQHLESLNDVVAQITGVRVRETVPDGILERADEIKLIDLLARGADPAPARGQGLHARRRPSARIAQLLPARAT